MPPSSESFDPSQVPPFPVISVEITTTEPARLVVEGVDVQAPAGVDLHDAAVAEAARRIAERGLPAARVAASSDGRRWSLVVTADGQRHDIGGPTPTTQARAKRRRSWILLAAAAGVVALAVGIAAVIVTSRGASEAAQQPPAPAGPSVPPPAELPIPIPEEMWSPQASWAVPVSSQQRPDGPRAVLTDTAIVVADDQGGITGFDAVTGVIAWRSPLPPGAQIQQGPVRTSIDGQPSIAVATSDTIHWWPLTGAPQPVGSVPVVAGEKVKLEAGSSPLVTIENGDATLAKVIQGGQLVPRTVPADATVARADEAAVTAVARDGRLWTLNTDAPTAPKPTAKLKFGKRDAGGGEVVLGATQNALLLPGPESGQAQLYSLDGKPIGEPADTSASQPWVTHTSVPYAVQGSTVTDDTKGKTRGLNVGWIAKRFILPGYVWGESTPDPKKGILRPAITLNPGLEGPRTDFQGWPEPPVTYSPLHGFFIAEAVDGTTMLYAAPVVEQ